MKKNLFKIIAALTLCICVLCSCGSKNGGGILKIDGKDVEVQSVFKIGDKEISYDMYRHWFLSVKATMLEEAPNTDFTKQENIDALKKKTLEQLKFICATYAIADKYGIKLTQQHQDDIESTMKDTFNSAGSADDYRALLAENFLTDETYREILEVNLLYDYIQTDYVGTDKDKNKIVFTQQDALERCNEDFYRLVDIYFMVETQDEDGNDLSDAQIEKNKKEAEKKINAAYDKIKSGKSFLDVLKEYRTDEEYELALQGYYKPESVSSAFDVDAEALKVGETTEPLYANSTYVIIHRLENDSEYLINNGVSPDGYNVMSVEEYYAQELLGEMVEKQMQELEVTEYEYYDKITPETLS